MAIGFNGDLGVAGDLDQVVSGMSKLVGVSSRDWWGGAWEKVDMLCVSRSSAAKENSKS